jgi:hypothetical protein
MHEIATPSLLHVADVRATVGAPIVVGQVPQGLRRVIPIVGGTVSGPRLSGRIIAAGADFQIIRGDGVAEVHARYVIETDAGELVYVENTGLRHGPPEAIARLNRGEAVDPALIYFRTVPRFETASPRLAWLARNLFLCSGVRHPDAVQLRYFEVS